MVSFDICGQGKQLRVYADSKELNDIAACRPTCIAILKEQLKKLNGHADTRAIDIAGGDGSLAKELLVAKYKTVDLFDRCPTAVKKAKLALRNHPRIGHNSMSTMEEFDWPEDYNAIFMVWVSGYLSNIDLVEFLKRAKTRLKTAAGPSRRKSKPGSFIILFDNVLAEGKKREPEKGQQFRTETRFEKIFKEASLFVHEKSGRK